MNEQQARDQGLHFAGVYSFDKEEVKTRIAEYRQKYPKARIVLVNEPYSKLSRSGPGMGYSAYACLKYSAYTTLERIGSPVSNHAERVNMLTNEFNKKLADEEARFKQELDAYNEAKTLLAN